MRPTATWRDLAHAHFVLEDYEAAIRTVKRMRRKNTILRTLAASQAMLGLDADARETVANSCARSGTGRCCPPRNG